MEGVAAGDWCVILTQTNSCVPVLGAVLFYFSFFSLQILTDFFSVFSLGVPRGIWEHLLNDPEWCSRGSMWAAGV